ncbi:MAG: alpha/beta fold hydrolase [Candidatus Acidiferrum sp.]
MKAGKMLRGVLGAGLCAVGLWMALSVPYGSRTFRVGAGGCRLITDIVEPTANAPADGLPQGYVVLLHGLSANKKIMSYLAAGFASQGLRVFVPDLPGHGRSDGPFSYQRSEECSENLVRELIGRGVLDPERTILAGHSLGGADALRVAEHIPVAGVIAISPAPMRPIKGIPRELLPFSEFGALPAHSLVMSAAWEPGRMREAAKELVPIPGDGTSEYLVIPHSTHVSILFNATAMSVSQKWAALVLHLKERPALPSRRGVLGFLAGFAGILLLAGPFLRETLQNRKEVGERLEKAVPIAKGRALVEYGIIALGTVGLLSYWNPLPRLRLFEGDYFAAFLLILGIVLLALHWNSVRDSFARGSGSPPARPLYLTLIIGTFAGLLLFVLIASWMDLSISETWLTAARWARFVPFLAVTLPYHFAEELLLGPASPGKTAQRLSAALLLRLIALGAIVAGLFLMHSGEVLLVLLAPYFGLFSLLQCWGMKVVREVTASAAVAALFGAILLAGFSLVVFPTT